MFDQIKSLHIKVDTFNEDNQQLFSKLKEIANNNT